MEYIWVSTNINRPPIIGTAIIYNFTPTQSNRVGLLIAFYCTQFYLAEGSLVYSLISRNTAGQTKKTVTLAMSFIAFAAGNAAAPQVSIAPLHSPANAILIHTALPKD